jgi:hypothetical protein
MTILFLKCYTATGTVIAKNGEGFVSLAVLTGEKAGRDASPPVAMVVRPTAQITMVHDGSYR